MRLLRYEPPPSQRMYVAPKGTEPTAYIRELEARAQSQIRNNDYHTALQLLQKRLAVISYYRGSRTLHAAQAMAGLAGICAKIGNEPDAQTWAHYALRAYAVLMMDVEARNKPGILASMATLHEEFPQATLLDESERSGVPDFTTGTLVRSTLG